MDKFNAMIEQLVRTFDGSSYADGLFRFNQADDARPNDRDYDTEWVFDIRPLQIAGTELAIVEGFVMVPELSGVSTFIDRITGVVS